MMHTDDNVMTTACWIEPGEQVDVGGRWATVENVVHHEDDTITIEFEDDTETWEHMNPGEPVWYYGGI